MPRIKKGDYNWARSKLVAAGSASASASHPIHNERDVPERYGIALLMGAAVDLGLAGAPIIANAARRMGIDAP